MGAPRTRGPRDGQKPHNELSHRDLFHIRFLPYSFGILMRLVKKTA